MKNYLCKGCILLQILLLLFVGRTVEHSTKTIAAGGIPHSSYQWAGGFGEKDGIGPPHMGYGTIAKGFMTDHKRKHQHDPNTKFTQSVPRTTLKVETPPDTLSRTRRSGTRKGVTIGPNEPNDNQKAVLNLSINTGYNKQGVPGGVDGNNRWSDIDEFHRSKAPTLRQAFSQTDISEALSQLKAFSTFGKQFSKLDFVQNDRYFPQSGAKNGKHARTIPGTRHDGDQPIMSYDSGTSPTKGYPARPLSDMFQNQNLSPNHNKNEPHSGGAVVENPPSIWSTNINMEDQFENKISKLPKAIGHTVGGSTFQPPDGKSLFKRRKEPQVLIDTGSRLIPWLGKSEEKSNSEYSRGGSSEDSSHESRSSTESRQSRGDTRDSSRSRAGTWDKLPQTAHQDRGKIGNTDGFSGIKDTLASLQKIVKSAKGSLFSSLFKDLGNPLRTPAVPSADTLVNGNVWNSNPPSSYRRVSEGNSQKLPISPGNIWDMNQQAPSTLSDRAENRGYAWSYALAQGPSSLAPPAWVTEEPNNWSGGSILSGAQTARPTHSTNAVIQQRNSPHRARRTRLPPPHMAFNADTVSSLLPSRRGNKHRRSQGIFAGAGNLLVNYGHTRAPEEEVDLSRKVPALPFHTMRPMPAIHSWFSRKRMKLRSAGAKSIDYDHNPVMHEKEKPRNHRNDHEPISNNSIDLKMAPASQHTPRSTKAPVTASGVHFLNYQTFTPSSVPAKRDSSKFPGKRDFYAFETTTAESQHTTLHLAFKKRLHSDFKYPVRPAMLTDLMIHRLDGLHETRTKMPNLGRLSFTLTRDSPGNDQIELRGRTTELPFMNADSSSTQSYFRDLNNNFESTPSNSNGWPVASNTKGFATTTLPSGAAPEGPFYATMPPNWIQPGTTAKASHVKDIASTEKPPSLIDIPKQDHSELGTFSNKLNFFLKMLDSQKKPPTFDPFFTHSEGTNSNTNAIVNNPQDMDIDTNGLALGTLKPTEPTTIVAKTTSELLSVPVSLSEATTEAMLTPRETTTSKPETETTTSSTKSLQDMMGFIETTIATPIDHVTPVVPFLTTTTRWFPPFVNTPLEITSKAQSNTQSPVTSMAPIHTNQPPSVELDFGTSSVSVNNGVLPPDLMSSSLLNITFIGGGKVTIQQVTPQNSTVFRTEEFFLPDMDKSIQSSRITETSTDRIPIRVTSPTITVMDSSTDRPMMDTTTISLNMMDTSSVPMRDSDLQNPNSLWNILRSTVKPVIPVVRTTKGPLPAPTTNRNNPQHRRSNRHNVRYIRHSTNTKRKNNQDARNNRQSSVRNSRQNFHLNTRRNRQSFVRKNQQNVQNQQQKPGNNIQNIREHIRNTLEHIIKKYHQNHRNNKQNVRNNMEPSRPENAQHVPGATRPTNFAPSTTSSFLPLQFPESIAVPEVEENNIVTVPMSEKDELNPPLPPGIVLPRVPTTSAHPTDYPVNTDADKYDAEDDGPSQADMLAENTDPVAEVRGTTPKLATTNSVSENASMLVTYGIKAPVQNSGPVLSSDSDITSIGSPSDNDDFSFGTEDTRVTAMNRLLSSEIDKFDFAMDEEDHTEAPIDKQTYAPWFKVPLKKEKEKLTHPSFDLDTMRKFRVRKGDRDFTFTLKTNPNKLELIKVQSNKVKESAGGSKANIQNHIETFSGIKNLLKQRPTREISKVNVIASLEKFIDDIYESILVNKTIDREILKHWGQLRTVYTTRLKNLLTNVKDSASRRRLFTILGQRGSRPVGEWSSIILRLLSGDPCPDIFGENNKTLKSEK